MDVVATTDSDGRYHRVSRDQVLTDGCLDKCVAWFPGISLHLLPPQSYDCITTVAASALILRNPA